MDIVSRRSSSARLLLKGRKNVEADEPSLELCSLATERTQECRDRRAAMSFLAPPRLLLGCSQAVPKLLLSLLKSKASVWL